MLKKSWQNERSAVRGKNASEIASATDGTKRSAGSMTAIATGTVMAAAATRAATTATVMAAATTAIETIATTARATLTGIVTETAHTAITRALGIATTTVSASALLLSQHVLHRHRLLPQLRLAPLPNPLQFPQPQE